MARTLDTWTAQARGAIGTRVDVGEELVFEFDGVRWRFLHMVGVRDPLEVEWYRNGDLVKYERMRPMTGFSYAKADKAIERGIEL